MRRADAPQSGWYPDPTGGSLLWWWDGLDWTDQRRNPPTPGMTSGVEVLVDAATHQGEVSGRGAGMPTSLGLKTHRRQQAREEGPPLSRLETADLMTEARLVARKEVDRAVQAFSQQARDATSRIEPLIAQYGDRIMKWVRNVGVAAFVVVVLWFLAQSIGAASLLDWIGNRIDNVTDQSTIGGVVALGRPG